MGLTSLSQLNRSGVYDYWENQWEGGYTYKNFLYTTFLLRDLFHEVFNFFFFKFLFKQTQTSLGYSKLYFRGVKTIPTIYFSKLWVIRYQNWLILLIYSYNLNLSLKKKEKSIATTYKYNMPFRLYKNYNFKF